VIRAAHFDPELQCWRHHLACPTEKLRCLLLSVLQERFYFGDGVLPLFESGIPLLLERLKQLPDRGR